MYFVNSVISELLCRTVSNVSYLSMYVMYAISVLHVIISKKDTTFFVADLKITVISRLDCSSLM